MSVRRYFGGVTVLALLVLCVLGLHLDVGLALGGIFSGLAWLGQNFAPNAATWADAGTIVIALWRTMVIAVAATTVAAGAALLLALAGAKATGRWPLVRAPIRWFASVMRNFPFVAWALLLLFSFKQNDFTGFLALTLMTVGYLTRAFIETLDETASGAMQALTATGASYWPTMVHAVLPQAGGKLLSWVLYMIENNVRDATLVGMLTGTGVGFLFDLYFKSFRYPSAGLVVVALILVTVAIELSAGKLRKELRK